MRELIFCKESLVWLALMLITLASWVLGTHHGLLADSAFFEMSAIMLLAFYKARLVILHFMEVAGAPNTLRLSCECWVLGSCALIILSGSSYFAA